MENDEKQIRINSTGLDLKREEKEHSIDDWVFGTGKEISGIAENIEAEQYLPTGEIQRGREDFMDCATRSPINLIETKLNYLYQNKRFCPDNMKWLEDNNFIDANGNIALSDRFTAILSGTTRNGNSLKAPCESIRKDGSIPKAMLPASDTMTWAQYHDKTKITQAMRDLGQEFLSRFPVNYEIVYTRDYAEILKKDMINTAGYAWPQPVNGIYPRVSNTINHAFMAFGSLLYKIFDNYLDQVDGDWIKRLASNYNLLGYSYRLIINEVKKNEEGENMKIAIEVVKRKNSPDYFLRDKKVNSIWHRIGNEKVFFAIAGDFPSQIEELDIATESIGEPIYFASSLGDIIVNFFNKLRGKN